MRGSILTYQAAQNLVYTSGQMHLNGLPRPEGNSVTGAEYVLGGNAPDEVWDVTDPLEVKRLAHQRQRQHRVARCRGGCTKALRRLPVVRCAEA